MNYNAIISAKDISDDSGTITEPVSVTEMKNYLRLAAFGGGSGTSSFDDPLIADMITAARQLIEEKAGLSLIYHSWEVVIDFMAGCKMEIPYGPIIRIWQVLDGTDLKNGITTNLSYSTEGTLWQYLTTDVTPRKRNIVLRYEAGYDVYTGTDLTERLPKAIKIDLMRLVAYMYLHRGDETQVEHFVSRLASKYSRNPMII